MPNRSSLTVGDRKSLSLQRRRRARAVAAILAAAVAAPVAGEETATGCTPVSAAIDGANWSEVAITGLRGISCADAEAVVRQCITQRTVADWQAAEPTAELGLLAGDRWIGVSIASGSMPTCLLPPPAAPTNQRKAGPFEGPSPMPPTSAVSYVWTSPVGTNLAYSIEIGTAVLSGVARTTDDKVRAVWFEYGPTRELGTTTRRQSAKNYPNDWPSPFEQPLKGLAAKTRYFWRAVASVDDGQGGSKTVNGATGSFVTLPYRKLAGVRNPCAGDDFGGTLGGATEVTESLAIMCSPEYFWENTVGLPVPIGHHGRLTCPRDYPRNLNAGSTSVTIPKIDYTLSTNNIVNYYRSNDSARFTDFPGYQKNAAGQEAGPVLGWHEWDIDHWGYLGSTSRTKAQMWIHCTDNWKSTSAEELAKGEGDDTPSTTAPSVPKSFTFTSVGGAYNATWAAPDTVSPAGIAGYQLNVDALQDPSPAKVWLTHTGLEGTISAAHVEAMKRIFKTSSLYAHVFAINREGQRGPAATIAFTAP